MKRLTKKRRLENEKRLVILNCLIVLVSICTLIQFKNYDKSVSCKKITGHWCNSYELGKMEYE